MIIYTRLYSNDPYTVKGELDFGGFYGKMNLDMFDTVMTELNTYGRKTLIKLIRLLNDNNKELIGTQGYRGIIYHTKKELAEIFGTSKQYIQVAISDLEKHNIVKYDKGVLMVNPLVYSQHSIFDIRVIQAFNVKLNSDKPTNKFTDNDSKASKAHVTNVYNTAVEVFATLCVELKLNPRKDGVILSHKEAHARGLASNHGDPEHLWKHYGYTMDGFRKAVIAKYDALKDNTSKLPYKVKVTEPELNVRKGAGTNYPVTTVVKKGDVFTIVEEKKNGTTLWGKLKSGAGWLSLKYTKKC